MPCKSSAQLTCGLQYDPSSDETDRDGRSMCNARNSMSTSRTRATRVCRTSRGCDVVFIITCYCYY